jgi:hypothetical protein
MGSSLLKAACGLRLAGVGQPPDGEGSLHVLPGVNGVERSWRGHDSAQEVRTHMAPTGWHPGAVEGVVQPVACWKWAVSSRYR